MNGTHDHTPADPARVVLAQRRNAGVQVTLLWEEAQAPSWFSSATKGSSRRASCQTGTAAIRPGSGAIRRSWLAAIRRRAVGAAD